MALDVYNKAVKKVSWQLQGHHNYFSVNLHVFLCFSFSF